VKFGYDLMSRFAAQYRVVVEVLLAAQDTSLTGMSDWPELVVTQRFAPAGMFTTGIPFVRETSAVRPRPWPH
jgi:hypothetical protein